MAKFEDGVLGKFRGKVGAIIGSKWRGTRYIRAKGPSKRSKNTPAQMEQQAKFILASKFASDMTDLFQTTFRIDADIMTERNSALAHAVKYAITGTYPAFSIDYSNALISRGRLKKPIGATATQAAGTVEWSWTFLPGENAKRQKDRAIVVAYCPFFENVIYNLSAAMRADNGADLNVSAFAGQTIHTWLAFITEDGKSISDSVYTGQFIVS